MHSGWADTMPRKTLLTLFGNSGGTSAPTGGGGGGMPYSPDELPRRRLWISYGAMALSGRAVVTRSNRDADEEALIALGLV